MIRIDDRHRIKFDSMNYSIEKKHMIKDTETGEVKEVWRPLPSYHGNFESLLKAVLEHKCKMAPDELESMKDLAEYMKSYGAAVASLIGDDVKMIKEMMT